MDRQGTVAGIFLAPDSGEPMRPVDSVEAVADRGLRGDRYFRERGLYDRRDDLPESTDVTLVEREALDAARRAGVALSPRETRRNVLTRGVSLEDLLDSEFRVGEATFVGVRPCTPCSYMESLADAEGAVDALEGRGGLNADVIESGTIAVDDAIEC